MTRFAIKPSYILNLERLKEKLKWPHIVEEKGEYDERVFCIKPEHSEGFNIWLYVGDDYEDMGMVAVEGVTHWHLDSGWGGDWRWRTIWKSLKTVRSLIAGELCGITATRADGQELFGGTISADGWDDLGLIWNHYCLPAGNGEGELVSAGGKRWRAPTFRRRFFNRPPSDEQPDWSLFAPVKNGWASPRERDQLLYHQITLGMDNI